MRFAFILICACIAVLSADDIRAEDTTLRVSVQVSTSSPVGKNMVEYKNAVERASNGTLRLDIYDRAQLFLDNQVVEAVGSGAVDMGIAPLGFFAKAVPAVEIFQQPFVFDSDGLTRAASRPESEIRRTIDSQILEKTGARVLWWEPYGATVIMSRDSPIPNPNALKGRNVRAFDPVSAEFVSLCGATPHVISGSKMLDALKTQKVDAVMTGVVGIPERELWRETQFITRIRHSAIIVVSIINENVWNRLSKRHRDIMIAAVHEVEDGFWDRFAAEEAAAYRFAAEKGMHTREISPDDLVEWRICSSELLERFAQKMGEDGARLLSAYGNLRTVQQQH